MSDVRALFDSQEENNSFSLNTSPLASRVRNTSKVIHYKKLKHCKWNREIKTEAVMKLVKSILRHGKVLDPLHITIEPNGDHVVLSGNHRLEAIIYIVETLGKEDYEYVRCIVHEYEPDKNHLLLIDTNLEREELSNYDKMIAIGEKEEILKRMNTPGTLRDVIAKESKNIKATQISTYLRIYKNGSKEVKKALKEDKITLTEAYAISAYDTEKQKEMLKKNKKNVQKKDKDCMITDLEEHLQSYLLTKVTISNNKISFNYNGTEDLNELLNKLGLLNIVNE